MNMVLTSSGSDSASDSASYLFALSYNAFILLGSIITSTIYRFGHLMVPLSLLIVIALGLKIRLLLFVIAFPLLLICCSTAPIS
jgi:hypothetical protein